MIRRFVVLAGLLLAALILPLQLRGQETAVSLPAPGLPTDQIIIQFNNSGITRHLEAIAANDLMPALSETAGVSLSYVRAMGLEAHHVLKLPSRLPLAEVEAIAANLQQRDDVLYAIPDRIKQHFDPPGNQPVDVEGDDLSIYLPVILSPDPVAVDPLRGQQWHYDYVPGSSEGINLYNAWGISTGSDSIVVAVIDTGILNHADLAGRTVPGYDFIHDSLVANDGNGRDNNPLDSGDWITSAESSSGYFAGCPVTDSSWHGTHVAGTVGAATNNGLGVAGVDQKAKILPVRALGKCGGYESDIVDGILWAANLLPGLPNPNPANVVNLSLGGGGTCSTAEQNAFNQLRNAGVTAVVAAGNNNVDAAGFSPGNCANVITVAATNRNGGRAYYSNYGAVVEVSAPGGAQSYANDPNGVLSTLFGGATTALNNSSYEFYQGTSMAAPHVAGVVSLIYSVHPGYSPSQVLTLLQTTARPFPSGSSCNTSICGSGIVDAYQALGGSVSPPPPPPPNPFTNPGFESGATGWAEFSALGWPLIINSGFPSGVTPHNGSWLAWLGGDYDETAYVQQQVSVPSAGSFLSYWHWIGSDDVCGFDFANILVNGTSVHQYDLCSDANTFGWSQKVVNLAAYAGQSVTLRIRVTTDSSLNSNLFLDDFSFQDSLTTASVDNERPQPSAEATAKK